MLVEVAGAHVLAPGFGTGLNAWAAMITVALGGLAAGYAIGGLAADRFPKSAASQRRRAIAWRPGLRRPAR